MHTFINNYDKLYELYGEQRVTGEYAVRRWQPESSSSQIDLNDSFDIIVMSNTDINWIHNGSNDNMTSPELSHQSHGISSRGFKRKAPIMDMLER